MRIRRLARPQASDDERVVDQTARIVKSYLTGNTVSPGGLIELLLEVGDTIGSIHQRLGNPGGPHRPTRQEIRDSIREEYLISFEDGKPYHMLRRHLTKCGLSVEQYKAKWSLPDDYPMVAPFYTRKRADLAKQTQLGHYDRSTAKPRPKYRRRKSAAPPRESLMPANAGSRRRQGPTAEPIGAV